LAVPPDRGRSGLLDLDFVPVRVQDVHARSKSGRALDPRPLLDDMHPALARAGGDALPLAGIEGYREVIAAGKRLRIARLIRWMMEQEEQARADLQRHAVDVCADLASLHLRKAQDLREERCRAVHVGDLQPHMI